nr:integrase, catalytic region, zinc finger, CCHC-type, peptidase aspartic, catalytic [Tanacetum cinerariifolium]
MNQQMNKAVRVAVQIQTDQLHDSYQRENDEFLRTIDDNMKRIIKEQVKDQVNEQVLRILPRIEQSVNANSKLKFLPGHLIHQGPHMLLNLYKAPVVAYEADKIILDIYGETVTLKRRRDDESDKDEGPSAGSDRGSKRHREDKEPESASAPLQTATRSAGRSTTGSKSRQASANESTFAEEPMQTTSQIEEPLHSVFETGAEDQPIVQLSQHPEWFSQPKKPLTLDRDWNKTLPAAQGSTQTWISKLSKQADSRSSFNELLDTPLEFSNFIMNRLRVDTLTPELLAGPTYELMKGLCKSLTELEYHLEEVYKATTNQLHWINPEGQQYPHNLLQPLSLIPDNRGRRVIPFAHFINNDLEYLRGGASSKKYTTSMTKTKAADYGHIKWIEDLVPRTMWIQEPINYDKHALWGVSHWGRKRQQFYGFAVNQESALDVYSKRRIIAVTDLKIVEWHSYKHLDWITVHRDDDKLYKFKEGDFKRMFTRSIVIQRRIEDLQLGVESYQKRLNLTKPDTIATPTIVPPREPIPMVHSTDKPVVTLVVQIVLWYLDSGCSKHMTGDRSQLVNFVQKFLGTVKFRNDHVAKIMGYGDYQIGNVTISRVYYVEGLGHNLFSVGQFWKQSVYSVYTRHDGVFPNMSSVQGIEDQVMALASSLVTSKQVDADR